MDELRVKDPDGLTIVAYRWAPPEPSAVVQILHGWAEHARRYDHVAAALVDAGYAVVAADHRGHGRTGLLAGGLGDLGPRDMEGVLDAVRAVTDRIREEYPVLPVFLLGHSWGSFLAQRYIRRWGDDLAGVLLTGTTLRRPGEQRGTGRRAAEDAEAGRYDWLTRDAAEVQRYVDDPMCGFERMARRPATATPADQPADDPGVPTELPILVFNGADDIVGGEEGGRALAEHYRASGSADVTLTSYPGAKHELFNELNRDEVITDVVDWLAAHAASTT